MKDDLKSSLANSTAQQYDSYWFSFTHFMSNVVHETYLPANPSHVALYITHLHSLGRAVSTIRCHMSSIAYFHKINYCDNPTSSFTISKLLISYTKSQNSVSNDRKPISHELLCKLLSLIKSSNCNKYDIRLYMALYICNDV